MNRRGFVKALGLVPVGVALSAIVTESPSNKVDPPKIKVENIPPEPFDGRVFGEMNHHLDAQAYTLAGQIDDLAFKMMTGANV